MIDRRFPLTWEFFDRSSVPKEIADLWAAWREIDADTARLIRAAVSRGRRGSCGWSGKCWRRGRGPDLAARRAILPLSDRAGAAGMVLRINRVRAVAADDAGFPDLLTALPDGPGPCLCCRRQSPDSLAMILAADESDDDPRALCGAIRC